MADTAQPGPMAAHGHEGGTRRDFLSIAATAVAGVGAACAVWPLISSMNPARDTLAAGAPIDVDISKIQPGQQIIVLWRSRPIYIVNRTKAMQDIIKADKDAGSLRDPNSNANQQPPYAKNIFRSGVVYTSVGQAPCGVARSLPLSALIRSSTVWNAYTAA